MNTTHTHTHTRTQIHEKKSSKTIAKLTLCTSMSLFTSVVCKCARVWEREWTNRLEAWFFFRVLYVVYRKTGNSMEHPCAHCYSFLFLCCILMLMLCDIFFFLLSYAHTRPFICNASDFCINKCELHHLRQLYDHIVQITVIFSSFFY